MSGQAMSDMRLVVVGAAGRMGQTLIRTIHTMDGVRVAGAVERAGSPHLGKDAGEIAGVGTIDVAITDDPLPAFAKADGVLDFTMPAATVEFAGYAAQARIVHVIGTTGCSADDDARIAAAARHATHRQVRQYEPRRQSAGGAGRAGGARARRRATSTSRSSKCTIATRSMRRPARRCCSARRPPPGAASTLAENSVRVARRPHRRAPGGLDRLRHAARRLGGRRPYRLLAGTGERITLSHQAEDRAIFARGAVKAALWARGKKPGLYSMRDVLGLS